MKKHIEKAWQNFADNVMPEDACEAQQMDMRDAYFAGAIDFHVMVNELQCAINHGEDGQPMDAKKAAKIKRAFVEDVFAEMHDHMADYHRRGKAKSVKPAKH